MTLEELSNKILDESFDSNLEHSDEVESSDNFSDFLEHYGVLGMKWGVRKDRKVPKKYRRFEGESDQEYQNRMNRESQERQNKANIKAREKSEKRAAKERLATQKRALKSQERMAAAQRKEAQRREEAQRKEQAKKADKKTKSNNEKGDKAQNVKSMTDEELRAAIARIRSEKEYQQLTKKPDGFATATLKKVGNIGGGVLIGTGKALATKYLTKYASEKIDDFMDKRKKSKDKPLGLPGKTKDGKKVR